MNTDIVIVGAGASGLMAARELARAGKKVIVLEAQSRIGGRIMPLDQAEFGYPAQGGAEYTHGGAPITKALIEEAGLHFFPAGGELWSARSGELVKSEAEFFEGDGTLKEKLNALKEDVSIADFLEQNFPGEKHAKFKNSIYKIVEGYDAADPSLISTFTVRDEWLGTGEWQNGRIREGYGALLDFLEKEIKNLGVEICLNTRVKTVEYENDSVKVYVESGEVCGASKVIITVAIPVLKDIEFISSSPVATSAYKEKLELVSRIGFGDVIKFIVRFKTRWWEHALGKDLRTLSFLLCNEKFMTWWNQYPDTSPTFVGWMAGPQAKKHKDMSDEELSDIALQSLANVFKMNKVDLAAEVVTSKIINWPANPFVRGAYSYTAVQTKDAREKLAEPIENTIFFAGEATVLGRESASVEGALKSGIQVAGKILT